jgi:arabinogalactan endo-1,4-beta-galactosidase
MFRPQVAKEKPMGMATPTKFDFLSILLLSTASIASQPLEYCIGADLSFLKQQEDRGTQFRDSGKVKPGLQIFRQHGYGWIRLRLFHSPTSLPNSLPYTIALAQQAKSYGFKFLLNYHYSDTWADPGNQRPPAAWNGLSFPVLTDSVYRYTRNTIAAFRQAGVMPDMVQIGNEITPGMLLPHGSTSNWNNLADLLKAGVRGVDSGRGASPMPIIMMHVDAGGKWNTVKWWFDAATVRNVPYDVNGLSYYAEWQGSLDNARAAFNNAANTYGKDVIMVETAHLGSASGFPLTNQGQMQFLQAVDSLVRAVPNGRGKGVMWWEPTASPGSTGDTRNFFDSNRNAKPVINVFDRFVLPIRDRRLLRLGQSGGIPEVGSWHTLDGRRGIFQMTNPRRPGKSPVTLFFRPSED